MEDQNKQDAAGPTIEHEATEAPKANSTWSLRNILLAAGAVVLVGGGVAVAQGGFGPHGMGHRMMGGFAEHRFERLMDEIDATKEQEDRIWAIVDATRAELRPVGREFRDSREEVAKILGAPTIDRAAAETLRAQRIAALDAASKKATAALLDAAEVLTPEQRAELVEHFEERRGWRRDR